MHPMENFGGKNAQIIPPRRHRRLGGGGNSTTPTTEATEAMTKNDDNDLSPFLPLPSLLSAVTNAAREQQSFLYQGWSTAKTFDYSSDDNNNNNSSTAINNNNNNRRRKVVSVSQSCIRALDQLVSNRGPMSLAVEASSHVSGLWAVYSQPWAYAGPGLGNMAECRYSSSSSTIVPSETTAQLDNNDSTTTASNSNINNIPMMHNCLAGTDVGSRDSLTFASICVASECSAYDLASPEFVDTLRQRVSAAAQTSWEDILLATSSGTDHNDNDITVSLGRDFVSLVEKTTEVNNFLQLGWTCGNLNLQFQRWPAGIPLVVLLIGTTVATVLATTMGLLRNRKRGGKGGTAASTSFERNRTPVLSSSSPWSLSSSDNTGTTTPLAKKEEEAESSQHFEMETRLENDDNNNKNEKGQQALDDNSPFVLELLQTDPLLSCDKNETNPQHLPRTTELREKEETRSGSDATATFSWLFAFDMTRHWSRLLHRPSNREETACLDGLRVFSVLWIILGHCAAIVSSATGGFTNPADFLPPTGFTSTVPGQLIFGGRLAVDTFLVVSGFLACTGIHSKLPLQNQSGHFDTRRSVLCRYLSNLPVLLLSRLVRILPLYAVMLGLYTLIAPILSTGPFWYKWLPLLKPCTDYGWTNLLFVNNFVPSGRPTTDTCFYHSWYLAVDMQLFLLAPLLVFWYQRNRKHGLAVTAFLCAASVVVTVWQSHSRHWSTNTFDGAAVSRYDIEAYAKPHIRAQSYLAGIIVAMLLLPETTSETPANRIPAAKATETKSMPSLLKATRKQQQRLLLRPRAAWTWQHDVALLLALVCMAIVTFGTAAYASRPCMYNEWPIPENNCGSSSWPPFVSFLWTALSRTVWILAISLLIYLCVGERRDSREKKSGSVTEKERDRKLGDDGSEDDKQDEELFSEGGISCCWVISSILSCEYWAKFAKLSLGVYLIHPIIIFFWQLSLEEKQTFSVINFVMIYISVVVSSYPAAFIFAVLVEFPAGTIWQQYFLVHRLKTSPSLTKPTIIRNIARAKSAAQSVFSVLPSRYATASPEAREAEGIPLLWNTRTPTLNSIHQNILSSDEEHSSSPNSAKYYGSTESNSTVCSGSTQ